MMMKEGRWSTASYKCDTQVGNTWETDTRLQNKTGNEADRPRSEQTLYTD